MPERHCRARVRRFPLPGLRLHFRHLKSLRSRGGVEASCSQTRQDDAESADKHSRRRVQPDERVDGFRLRGNGQRSPVSARSYHGRLLQLPGSRFHGKTARRRLFSFQWIFSRRRFERHRQSLQTQSLRELLIVGAQGL